MIKLVAFDWNGTILSDTSAVIKSESAVLVKYGLNPTYLKEFQRNYTVPLRTYWTNMGINPKIFDRDSRKIRKIFFDAYESLENKCRTRSNSRTILDWLKKNKILSVIFSNHPATHIAIQVKRLKIDKQFANILGYATYKDHSMMYKRGKEEELRRFIQKLKFKPKEVVLVGDTEEEIEIGQRRGYFTVALTGGYQNVRRLKAAKPDFLINNLLELKKIIQGL